MDNGMRISANGMINRMKILDVIANNVTNLNTDFYKEIVPYTIEDKETKMPVVKMRVNMQSGTLKATKNNLDFALFDKFFLKVRTNDGEEFYIKGGRFTIDRDGVLKYKNYIIPDKNGGDIILNSDKDFFVNSKGEIYQNGKFIGAFDIKKVAESGNVKKIKENLYIIDNVENPDSYHLIKQGYKETSNVNRAKQMTNMINVLRIYETNQKSFLIQDEVLSKTISELTRF